MAAAKPWRAAPISSSCSPSSTASGNSPATSSWSFGKRTSRMSRAQYLALLLVLSAPAALAQTATTGQKPISLAGGDQDNGVHAATILSMAISPRAVGLAEAMGAIEGDPGSMWYNAAGLARIKTNAFMVTARQGFADTQLGGASITFP